MKKIMVILVLSVGLVALIVPSALAAKSDAKAAMLLAQDDCGGGVCITDEQTDFGGPSIDPSTVKDPPGHTMRSLIMLSLLAVAFMVYLRLALVRGAKIG